MIKNQNKPSLLSKAMKENAIFSGLAGLVLIVGASGLDGWLGVDAWLLAAIGLGLVVYAADLMWWSRSPRWLVTGGRMAVVADLGWVVAAAALIAFTAVLTRHRSSESCKCGRPRLPIQSLNIIGRRCDVATHCVSVERCMNVGFRLMPSGQ